MCTCSSEDETVVLRRASATAERWAARHCAALAYGTRDVWQDAGLGLHRGEFLAVLGPNWSGKTSFIEVLLGRVPLSPGQLTALGRAASRGRRPASWTRLLGPEPRLPRASDHTADESPGPAPQSRTVET
ncbi:ATP-binding cassette domain-containing protein [Streptomyces galbus]|uniref:ATP-binding cassette domain-containing protein n=1 Tax=Streptomyces galbus TaxID=33898 RepID=UPI00380A3952